MVGINLGISSCRIIEGTDESETRLPNVKPLEGMFADGEHSIFKITHKVNCASQVMHLLGFKFSDPELQSELGFLPFRVIEGTNGYPLICGVRKDKAFTPVEILAMLISHLGVNGDSYSMSHDPDPLYYHPSCIPKFITIAIPTYFTWQQISNVYTAFNFVGIEPEHITVLDETTAMTMAYRKSWSFYSLREVHNVAFVDIGHSSMQVCFAKVNQEIHHIFYKAYMKSVGGRSFDIVLFKHFVYKIWKDYKINVYQSAHDCVELLNACEDLKKDLSKYNQASFSIKFSNGKVVEESMKREVFENLNSPILIQIKAALQKAICDSGLKKRLEPLHVEAVGNGCRMPAIIDILREVFDREPNKMTCSDEYVVRGCALYISEEWKSNSLVANNLELVSSKLPSEEVNEDKVAKCWIRAMTKEGHPLISLDHYLPGILGQDLQDLGISENINDGWPLIPEPSDQKDDITSTHIPEHTENDPNNQKEEKPISSKQFKFEGDNARNKEDEVGKLKDCTPTSQCVGYFAEFKYSEFKDATNNFHDSFIIGQGGFGIVYKGILHKTMVAIKMLKDGSSQGTKEFNVEVEILSKVRHPNLITLMGACSETRALIYEYLPNGSLEDRLRCKNDTPPLSWQNRVRIAFEVCSALNFLHCTKPHGIAHGDLKPDNILLDSNNVSKISDFGLSRQLNYTDSASVPFHVTNSLKGTLAYMDPDYFLTFTMTPQYDIFAFGIILLRMVTGKDPKGLRNLVETALEKGKIKTVIDSSAKWPFEEAMKMISLGLRCSDPVRKNRPNLSTKVWNEIESMVGVASASAPSLFSRLFHRHH